MSHSADKDLDCSNAGRGVWLVKVPKYISQRWDKAPGNIEAGRLKIKKTPGEKPQITFTLSEAIMCLEKDDNIPKEHKFFVNAIPSQTLGVFSQVTPTADSDSIIPETEKLCLEGKVIQKAECRPIASDKYMKLKKNLFMKASQPARQMKQLDKAVINYKPVATHQHLVDYEVRKKTEGKKSRDDKDKVMDVLFAAFEKHQYYNIKDLVRITQQPVVYLKEILGEVCNYNLKNPHKNMWELKPEYRHYKDEDKD